MTTRLDLVKALAARPDPLPGPLAFIAHPAWTEDEGTLRILQGMQANGIDVRVQTDIRLPSVSLDCWLGRPKPAARAPVRHQTFAELSVQAQQLVAEAKAAGRGTPVFVVTEPEVQELLRANCWRELPPGAKFYGMAVRVLHG